MRTLDDKREINFNLMSNKNQKKNKPSINRNLILLFDFVELNPQPVVINMTNNSINNNNKNNIANNNNNNKTISITTPTINQFQPDIAL